MAAWLKWLGEGPRVLALAISFATLIFAWMFAFETLNEHQHRNRFTGIVCRHEESCWFSREPTAAEKYEQELRLEEIYRQNPLLRPHR